MLHLEKKDLVASTIRFRVVMLVFDHHHPDGLVLVHGCSIVANRVCTIDRDWGANGGPKIRCCSRRLFLILTIQPLNVLTSYSYRMPRSFADVSLPNMTN